MFQFNIYFFDIFHLNSKENLKLCFNHFYSYLLIKTGPYYVIDKIRYRFKVFQFEYFLNFVFLILSKIERTIY